MAYESRYTVLPAYYSINFKTKFARDEESEAMIDVILNNRLYDVGEMYSISNMGEFFRDLSAGKNNLASFWERHGDRVILAMDKTADKIREAD